MRLPLRSACLLFLPLLPVSAALGQSASPANTLTAAEKAAGWRLLFDGKTTAGWDDPARKSPPGDSWTIEDGCLKSRAKPRIGEDLVSRETFGDFELVFDWRISPGGNSGVKYRIQELVFMDNSKFKPGAKSFEELVDYEILNRPSVRSKLAPGGRGGEYVVAFEYQLIDNERHRDAQRGSKYQAGALYHLAAPVRPAARPIGEFNHSRLVLRGNRTAHWLNGEKVLDTVLDSEEVKQGLEKRWGKASPVYKLLAGQPRRNCPISLQNHGDEAWFRNIKIRPLPAGR